MSLSYIDVQELNKNYIVKGNDGGLWIRTKRVKTNILVKTPILDKAQMILNKYSKYYQLISKYAVLQIYSNQNTDIYFKEIAEELNILKNLTFQVARRIFATLIASSNGVSIEAVTKLLGGFKVDSNPNICDSFFALKKFHCVVLK
ncbi:MAG: hypothetical protein WA749_10465 [Gelidibacter sp.]